MTFICQFCKMSLNKNKDKKLSVIKFLFINISFSLSIYQYKIMMSLYLSISHRAIILIFLLGIFPYFHYQRCHVFGEGSVGYVMQALNNGFRPQKQLKQTRGYETNLSLQFGGWNWIAIIGSKNRKICLRELIKIKDMNDCNVNACLGKFLRSCRLDLFK